MVRDARNPRKSTVITPPEARAEAASKAVKRAKAATAATAKKSAIHKSGSSATGRRGGGYDAVPITECRVAIGAPAAKRKLRDGARGSTVSREGGPQRKSQPEMKPASATGSHGGKAVDEESDAHIPKTTNYWRRTAEGRIAPNIAV